MLSTHFACCRLKKGVTRSSAVVVVLKSYSIIQMADDDRIVRQTHTHTYPFYAIGNPYYYS